MKIKKIFMLILLSIFSLCALSTSYAQELSNEEQIMEPAYEKIYVSPDRILIYPEGIFYLNEAGDVTPAMLISIDASGLYVVKTSRRCYACGRRLDNNDLCQNNDCRMFGR